MQIIKKKKKGKKKRDKGPIFRRFSSNESLSAIVWGKVSGMRL